MCACGCVFVPVHPTCWELYFALRLWHCEHFQEVTDRIWVRGLLMMVRVMVRGQEMFQVCESLCFGLHHKSVVNFFSSSFRWLDSPAHLKHSKAKQYWSYTISTMGLSVRRKHSDGLLWWTSGVPLRDGREKTLTPPSLNTNECSWSFTAEDYITHNPLLLPQNDDLQSETVTITRLDSINFLCDLYFSSLFYGFIVFSAHTGTKEASGILTIPNNTTITIIIKLAWAAHLSLILVVMKKPSMFQKSLSWKRYFFSDFP